VIFFPLLHVLDIIFLLLSTCGVALEFTLLSSRAIASTDEVCRKLIVFPDS